MPITKAQALSADEFHLNGCSRETGPRGGVKERIVVWRRNGATKTWKTRPAEFSVPVKYGMRHHRYISDLDAGEFHLPADCPLGGS